MTVSPSLNSNTSHGKSAGTLIPVSPLLVFFKKNSWLWLFLGALLVVTVMVWQALIPSLPDDAAAAKANPLSASLNIGVLVFREGLECVLVLAALTAGMSEASKKYRWPVAVGVLVGALVTVLTWFIAIAILDDLGENISALNLQAATGLLAIVVLLVVMNWFFHKIYWSGWITSHNRKKRELLNAASDVNVSKVVLWWGLGLLGFASFYREGFEVVLFLQGYRLKFGPGIVLHGMWLGLVLSGVMAVLTFVLHQSLPYRKMMILTGVLLGVVLLVMVGEQAQEMQLAHWISTTKLDWLTPWTPDWVGTWFSVFPTVETLASQGLAAILVVGSYLYIRYRKVVLS